MRRGCSFPIATANKSKFGGSHAAAAAASFARAVLAGSAAGELCATDGELVATTGNAAAAAAGFGAGDGAGGTFAIFLLLLKNP